MCDETRNDACDKTICATGRYVRHDDMCDKTIRMTRRAMTRATRQDDATRRYVRQDDIICAASCAHGYRTYRGTHTRAWHVHVAPPWRSMAPTPAPSTRRQRQRPRRRPRSVSIINARRWVHDERRSAGMCCRPSQRRTGSNHLCPAPCAAPPCMPRTLALLTPPPRTCVHL